MIVMSNEEIKKEFEVEDKKPAWEILNEQKEKLLEIIKKNLKYWTHSF